MKIFIVGGGFAGIKAAKELSKIATDSCEIYLINKSSYTTMLPNLPEVVSGRLAKKDITGNIKTLLPSSVKFIEEEVCSLDFDEKKITTKSKEYIYDYLVFAAGSTTNFFGFKDNLDKVHVLDSLNSAEDISSDFLKYLDKVPEANLVISGAGFTGIELACNLYDLCKKKNKKLKVTLVELGKKVLPMLSEKSSRHITSKLKELKFNISTENQITSFDGSNVRLKSGEIINDAFFCWCSGVKSSLKPTGNFEALPDGRIIVNEFLSLPSHPEVFIAGDAAAIKDKNGTILRRAVTFSEMSGKQAGKNIALHISQKQMEIFKPVDLGWIIPMYITSVGVAMGMEIRGRKGIFMHYMICGVKNYSFRNFLKEFAAAVKYPFAKP